jgi:hypothetical protein
MGTGYFISFRRKPSLCKGWDECSDRSGGSGSMLGFCFGEISPDGRLETPGFSRGSLILEREKQPVPFFFPGF